MLSRQRHGARAARTNESRLKQKSFCEPRAALAFAVVALCKGLAVYSAGRDIEGEYDQSALRYTAAQATAGSTLYQARCQGCHGSALEGGAGPALSGATFASRWDGKPVSMLFDAISRTMPLDAPQSLSQDAYLTIIAYLLKENGVAAGNIPLSPSRLQAPMPPTPGRPWQATGPLPPLPAAPENYGHPTTTVPTEAELLNPNPADWPMANRDYRGQRYSPLAEINVATAHRLAPVCVLQLGQLGPFSGAPAAHKGVLYITAEASTWAVDGATCNVIWKYRYVTDEHALIPAPSRGVALYEGALYRTTPTGHLVALDMKTGALIWDVWVSSVRKGYWMDVAPVVFDGKVFVGEAGAETGSPGHLYAFDAASGKHLWTFNYIPAPGEPGSETWKAGADHGGGSNWSTYTVDPDKHLIYASVGNPGPDFMVSARPGSNLYTDSVLAVDVRSGKLVWYAQQVANDGHDWDTAASALLYTENGVPIMAAANKGGWLFFYNRDTRRLLVRQPVTTHKDDDLPVTPAGTYACPGLQGGVPWNGPAYSPIDKMVYVGSVDWCGTYKSEDTPFVEGSFNLAGLVTLDPSSSARGWIRAFDATTLKPLWSYETDSPVVAGTTPTAGGVLFSGTLNGDFLTFDAKSGRLLYRFHTGGAIAGGITSYGVGRRQYVAVESGNNSRVWQSVGSPSLFVFAIR
jgi:alcohol dehydrogenase (cytochrome c)